MKGQNLRILFNSKCILAARSCDVNVEAQIESVSSKDSEDWEENECVGKSWSGSAEAVVIDGKEHGSQMTGGGTTIISSQVYYFSKASSTSPVDKIHLLAGEKVAMYGNEYGFAILNGNTTTVLAKTTGVGSGKYLEYTAESEMDVVLATNSYASTYPVNYTVYDANSLSMNDIQKLVETMAPVTVKFAATTGTKNRQIDNSDMRPYQGQAILNSFSMNANNRQRVTFSVGWTGTGEFAQPAPLTGGRRDNLPRWDGTIPEEEESPETEE